MPGRLAPSIRRRGRARPPARRPLSVRAAGRIRATGTASALPAITARRSPRLSRILRAPRAGGSPAAAECLRSRLRRRTAAPSRERRSGAAARAGLAAFLEADVVDDLAPFLLLVGEELRVFLRRARRGDAADIGVGGGERRRLQRRDRRRIEPFLDLQRRGP